MIQARQSQTVNKVLKSTLGTTTEAANKSSGRIKERARGNTQVRDENFVGGNDREGK